VSHAGGEASLGSAAAVLNQRAVASRNWVTDYVTTDSPPLRVCLRFPQADRPAEDGLVEAGQPIEALMLS